MQKKLFINIILFFIIGGFIWKFVGDSKETISSPVYKGTYVALGDSVAAGVGLTDYSDPSACDRTEESYPKQIAQMLNYKVTNLACSGATLPEGILGNQSVNHLQVNSQLQTLFAKPKPNLVTITIGANDAQWTTILGQCYKSDCGRSVNQALVSSTMLTITNNLDSVLNQIKSHYKDPPKIIVTGYYQVFPTSKTADCNDLTGIDATEIAVGRTFQTELNTAIENSVKSYPFATYASVNFTGHELCTKDPWIQGLNDPEPYHPTKEGQTVYAKQVIDILKKFQ